MKNTIHQYLQDEMPRYLELLHEMVGINSFTSNPEGVNALGAYTAAKIADLGFRAEFIQSVNPDFGKHLFMSSQSNPATKDPSRPSDSILCIAHLDTVFSPEEEKANNFAYRIEGDRVYGPGAVDIKGGTVMIYMVLDALRKFFPDAFEQTHWVIALDASEENLSEDFGKICLEFIPENTSACLVFEGGTPNRSAYPLVTCRKGRAEFRVIAEGRGAHAGNFHKQGANAIVQLAQTIQQIAALTNYPDQITFNVGVVNGGSVVNRVPHYAQATVEMRAFSPPIFQGGIDAILSLDGTSSITSQDGYPCKVSVEMISRSEPWPQNPGTDRLYHIWKETGATLDMQIIPEERGGLSDGNLLWQRFPVLDGLGPSGTNAHCSERSPDKSKDQEYALLPSFVPKAILNLYSILRLLNRPA